MACGVHLGILLICLVQAEHVCCLWATQARGQNSNTYVGLLEQGGIGGSYPQNQLRQASGSPGSSLSSSLNTDSEVGSGYSETFPNSGDTETVSKPAKSGYASVRLAQSSSQSKPNWGTTKLNQETLQKMPEKQLFGLPASIADGSPLSKYDQTLSKKRTWPVQQGTPSTSKYRSSSSASLQSPRGSYSFKPSAGSETPAYSGRKGHSTSMKSSILWSAGATEPRRIPVRTKTSASAPARRVSSSGSSGGSKLSRFLSLRNERTKNNPSQTRVGNPYQSNLVPVNVHNLPASGTSSAGSSGQGFAPSSIYNIPQYFGGYAIRRLREPADQKDPSVRQLQAYVAPQQPLAPPPQQAYVAPQRPLAPPPHQAYVAPPPHQKYIAPKRPLAPPPQQAYVAPQRPLAPPQQPAYVAPPPQQAYIAPQWPLVPPRPLAPPPKQAYVAPQRPLAPPQQPAYVAPPPQQAYIAPQWPLVPPRPLAPPQQQAYVAPQRPLAPPPKQAYVAPQRPLAPPPKQAYIAPQRPLAPPQQPAYVAPPPQQAYIAPQWPLVPPRPLAPPQQQAYVAPQRPLAPPPKQAYVAPQRPLAPPPKQAYVAPQRPLAPPPKQAYVAPQRPLAPSPKQAYIAPQRPLAPLQQQAYVAPQRPLAPPPKQAYIAPQRPLAPPPKQAYIAPQRPLAPPQQQVYVAPQRPSASYKPQVQSVHPEARWKRLRPLLGQ